MKSELLFEINQIIDRAEMKGKDHLAGYAFQLDDYVSELEEVSPEVQKLLDKTIQFLFEATT